MLCIEDGQCVCVCMSALHKRQVLLYTFRVGHDQGDFLHDVELQHGRRYNIQTTIQAHVFGSGQPMHLFTTE